MRLDINAAQANFRSNSTTEYDNELEQNIQRQRDEYVIQAVANLGQRLGVKGDSIKTDSFSFRDLFIEASNSKQFSSTTHIGKIERRYGSMYLSIVPRKNLKYATAIADAVELNVINSGDVLVSSSAIENPSAQINGVDFYKQSSVIAVRTAEYVFCGIGYSTDGSGDSKPCEFIYEEFDKTTHVIINAIRLRKINGVNLLIAHQNTSDRIIIDTYQLASGDDVFNASIDAVNDLLHEMNGYEYNSVDKTYENKGVTNEARINQMSLSYWLSFFKISKYASSHMNAYKIKDTGSNPDSYDLNDFSGDNEKMLSTYKTELQTICNWIKYDENELFEDLKEIYSQQMYASSNDDFRQQILCAIFNGVYNNYPTKAVIYVPIDFKFNYYCNSNDSWKIYGSVSDINVKFVNVSITANNLATYYSNDQLIANVSGDNRSALYDYEVEYDDKNPDIVYKVNVHKKYTMPYINSDDLWVINDQITNIVAKGKDAGNPNVIIVYNYNAIDDTDSDFKSYKVLASADYKKINQLNWKLKTARIQPIEQINIDDPQIVSKYDLYNIACRVPSVSDEDYYFSRLSEAEREHILSLLKYSIIFNISSVQCFERVHKDILDRYGEYGVVTSLWVFNESTLDYDLIEHPGFEGNVSNVAFDLTAMANLNNLVKWHIMNTEYKHPDRYSHRWIVLDNANIELKNNELDYRTYIYPVIMNKPTDKFNCAEYSNDLNFIVKYNDAIAGAEEEMITSISHTNAKYMTSETIPILSSLYYQKINQSVLNWDEYVPNYNVPVFHLSEVLTKDINVLNRTNMLSLNVNGEMYYSYIGSAFDDPDKNVVHIGGSERNINLGEETMINNSNRNLFKRPTKLSLDFENNYINGFTYVKQNIEVEHDSKVYHINWEIHRLGSLTVYKTHYIPDSKYIFQESELDAYSPNYTSPVQFNNNTEIYFTGSGVREKITNGQMKRYYQMAANFKNTSKLENHKLWVPAFYVFSAKYVNKQKNGIYIGDLLYIPALLCRLRLSDYSNLLNVKVVSNMDIITFGNVPLFLKTSNRFIKDISYPSNVVDDSIAMYNVPFDSTFIGNDLAISYYIESRTLYITINEVSNNQKIDNLFKLKLNY